LKSLLNSIGGEEKDSFVANFNSAYAKILAYERTNQEFKHMFSIGHANSNSRNPSNQRNNNKNNCDKSRSNVSIDLSPAAAITPLHSNKN